MQNSKKKERNKVGKKERRKKRRWRKKIEPIRVQSLIVDLLVGRYCSPLV